LVVGLELSRATQGWLREHSCGTGVVVLKPPRVGRGTGVVVLEPPRVGRGTVVVVLEPPRVGRGIRAADLGSPSRDEVVLSHSGWLRNKVVLSHPVLVVGLE
jgi:hypothetical protein